MFKEVQNYIIFQTDTYYLYKIVTQSYLLCYRFLQQYMAGAPTTYIHLPYPTAGLHTVSSEVRLPHKTYPLWLP